MRSLLGTKRTRTEGNGGRQDDNTPTKQNHQPTSRQNQGTGDGGEGALPPVRERPVGHANASGVFAEKLVVKWWEAQATAS